MLNYLVTLMMLFGFIYLALNILLTLLGVK